MIKSAPFSPEWLSGQLLCYQVAKRRRKWLQQLRSLKRCILHHGASHPKVHPLICEWLQLSDQAIADTQNSVVNKIITEETEHLVATLKTKCPLDLNQQFFEGKKNLENNIIYIICWQSCRPKNAHSRLHAKLWRCNYARQMQNFGDRNFSSNWRKIKKII